MAFFPTTAQITAKELLASIEHGRIDVPDAIAIACEHDGIDPDQVKTLCALIYAFVNNRA